MHYFVAGVNGSGKTTLLRDISTKTGIAVVQGTSELLKHLNIAGDYDALRALDQAYVLEKWGETAEQLLVAHGKQSFLLDTHILNLTNGVVIRRDGPWIGHYDALILITAEPKVILTRVANDTARDRALFPVDMSVPMKLSMIKDYQRQTEELFASLAKTYGLPSKIIFNAQGSSSEAVQQFIDFQKSLEQ